MFFKWCNLENEKVDKTLEENKQNKTKNPCILYIKKFPNSKNKTNIP